MGERIFLFLYWGNLDVSLVDLLAEYVDVKSTGRLTVQIIKKLNKTKSLIISEIFLLKSVWSHFLALQGTSRK